MRSLLLSMCSILAITLTAAPASAQSVTATLSGTIVDPSRQVVVGATVTLVNERTDATRTVVSRDDGAFFFAAVQPASTP